jgi:hypothetical protein
MALNFDEFKSRKMHDKHAAVIWNLGATGAFAYKHRKSKKACVDMSVCRIFRFILTSGTISSEQNNLRDLLTYP